MSNPQTTSWVVVILGILVSFIGYSMLPDNLGAGLLGFGLAHVVLGLLDRIRPSLNRL